jgi:hypothetical protein
MKRAHLAAFVVLALLALAVAEADSARSALFRRALENHSSAPNYVLITLVSADGSSRREVCIPAPFLLGALQREHRLAGQSRALDLALSKADFVFRFKDPKAGENVQPQYTEAILAEVRARLKGLSRSELLAGFHGGSGPLDALYSRHRAGEYTAWRDAVAHILLERGLLPGHGDPAGVLTVQE